MYFATEYNLDMLVNQPVYFQNLSFAAVTESTNIPVVSLPTANKSFLYAFCRYLLGFIVFFSTWFIWNTIRLIREKREVRVKKN